MWYNFGLHAFRLDGAAYEKGYAAMLDRLAGRSRVVVATSTRALNEARDDDDEAWRVKLAERNAIVKRLAAERNLIVNDLGALSQAIPTGYFSTTCITGRRDTTCWPNRPSCISDRRCGSESKARGCRYMRTSKTRSQISPAKSFSWLTRMIAPG